MVNLPKVHKNLDKVGTQIIFYKKPEKNLIGREISENVYEPDRISNVYFDNDEYVNMWLKCCYNEPFDKFLFLALDRVYYGIKPG